MHSGFVPGGTDEPGTIEHFAYALEPYTDLQALATSLESEGYRIVHEPEEGSRPGSDSLGVLAPDGMTVPLVVPKEAVNPISPGMLATWSSRCPIRKNRRIFSGPSGFKVTEYNEPGLVFMRSTPLHHDLGLVPLPEGNSVGLHHMAFDIGAILDVARAERFLREKSVRIEKGPGVWNQGHTPSFSRTVTFGEPEIRKEFQKF